MPRAARLPKKAIFSINRMRQAFNFFMVDTGFLRAELCKEMDLKRMDPQRRDPQRGIRKL